MDGGRVLRALLAMRMDYVRATQTAARIGQGMAVLFVLTAIVIKNPFLLLIAVFVWLGASSEASSVELRDVLGSLPAREAMITQFQTVTPEEPLRVVMAHIMDGYQRDFPVVSGERVVGMLTRADLLKALAEGGHEQPVSDAMQREFEQAAPSELLAAVFRRLQQCRCHSFPVIDHGRLVGVIDMENVGEFIAFRQALRGWGK
jgi:CBS domain-containing protein